MSFQEFYNSIWNIEYILQILVAEAMCCLNFQRRSRFVLRATLSVAVCIGLYMLMRAADSLIALTSLPPYVYGVKLIAAFALSIAAMFVCFKELGWSIVFVACAAQSMQHTVFEIAMLITRELITDIGIAAYIFINLAVFIVGYAVLFLMFVYKMNSKEFSNVVNKRLIFTVIICVVICFGISWYGQGFYSGAGAILFRFTVCMLCFILLAYQFSFLDNSTMVIQNGRLQQILIDSQKKYELLDAKREIINIKCHDIKKQLREYGEKLRIDDDSLHDMLDAVNIYDTSMHTGNRELDILLSDKALHCEQEKISFGAIVDGAACSFMQPMDLYALFGNLLDNAIEAVKQLKDPAKAVINLNVRREGKLLLIHCENYFSGDIKFVDGLPVTTKDNEAYHGYGIKSIKHIAEEYNGIMSCSVDGDVFFVNIILSIGSKTKSMTN